MRSIFARLGHNDASATRTEAAVPEPRCCFCQKAQRNVTNLIAGPENLRICDECVALMCDIIAEQNDKWRKRQIKRLMKRDSLSK
jgi:ClpX C4-type zinc finger protein